MGKNLRVLTNLVKQILPNNAKEQNYLMVYM
jgi:hypothetical protein